MGRACFTNLEKNLFREVLFILKKCICKCHRHILFVYHLVFDAGCLHSDLNSFYV